MKWKIVFLTTFLLGLWCVDISVTTMLVGGVVTNGFITNNPAITYHLGLAVAILSFIIILFIWDYEDNRRRK